MIFQKGYIWCYVDLILGIELPIELLNEIRIIKIPNVCKDSRRSTLCRIPLLSPLVTLLYFNLHLKLNFILY